MKSITFEVPGTPVPKPRQTRSDVWKQRPCVMRYRAWADDARAACAARGGIPRTGALAVFVNFVFGFPKKHDAGRHIVKPDVDNLVKAVLDAVIPSDQRVFSVQAFKQYGDRVGTVVTVSWEG